MDWFCVCYFAQDREVLTHIEFWHCTVKPLCVKGFRGMYYIFTFLGFFFYSFPQLLHKLHRTLITYKMLSPAKQLIAIKMPGSYNFRNLIVVLLLQPVFSQGQICFCSDIVQNHFFNSRYTGQWSLCFTSG